MPLPNLDGHYYFKRKVSVLFKYFKDPFMALLCYYNPNLIIGDRVRCVLLNIVTSARLIVK